MIKQNRYHPFCSTQQGLTMIELMIAMLLGLLLMGGMIQIFVSSKKSYNIQEAQARIQENGRLSMNIMPYDVRHADFQGCRSRQHYAKLTFANIIAQQSVGCNNQNHCSPDLDTSIFEIDQGISGMNDVPANTAVGGKTVTVGTDTVSIQFAGSCGGHLIGNMESENANIQISANNTCDLEQDWPFMITDCLDADIARASSVSEGQGTETVAHANNVNISNRLSKAYKSDAEIYKIESITYFISLNPANNNALYRRDNFLNSTEEIVDGVDDMQILYGKDTDGDNTANFYADASKFIDATTGKLDMSKVVSIKLNLIVRSLSEVNVIYRPEEYSYYYWNDSSNTYLREIVKPEVKTNRTDKLCYEDRICPIYKSFTSAITLRNRLP